MKTETPLQIAERIARHHLDSERVSVTQCSDIITAIEAALNAERERCATIAEIMATGETYGTGRQKAINIAAAIRGSKD